MLLCPAAATGLQVAADVQLGHLFKAVQILLPEILPTALPGGPEPAGVPLSFTALWRRRSCPLLRQRSSQAAHFLPKLLQQAFLLCGHSGTHPAAVYPALLLQLPQIAVENALPLQRIGGAHTAQTAQK